MLNHHENSTAFYLSRAQLLAQSEAFTAPLPLPTAFKAVGGLLRKHRGSLLAGVTVFFS